jgi:predicted TIM-barrel fold metal-dependent hydrolase
MPLENGLVLLDADAHVKESADLWAERLPAALRDQAPRFAGEGPGPGGGADPNLRVGEMAQDGVYATILHPTRGMHLFHIEDAPLQEACMRAYNDYLIEYCSVAPDRLYGIALIPVYNIDNAVKELERCRKAGLVGAMVWMTPHPDLPFSKADHYDRFWAAAQDTQTPITIHINTGFDYVSLTPQEKRGGASEYCHAAVNARLNDAAGAMLDIIFTGAFDRYPQMKLVLAETEVGWLPFYLQQFDHSVKRFGSRRPIVPHLELLPSEYFARQIYATFLEDPVGSQNFAWWETGVDHCMWSTDYPHSRTSWPHSRELMQKLMGHLPAADMKKLVHDNVAQLFGMKVPELV